MQRLKLWLRALTSHTGVPGYILATLSPVQLPKKYLGGHWVMAEVLGSLFPMWEIQNEFYSPGFGAPWMLETFGMEALSPSANQIKLINESSFNFSIYKYSKMF